MRFNSELNLNELNTIHTDLFLQKGVDDFQLNGYSLPSGYRLVKAKKENEYRLITDSASPVTAYAVKLVRYDHIVKGFKNCTQVRVWRSIRPEHHHAVVDFASLFFAYLVNHFTIVISDSHETELNRRFWEFRVMEALSLPAIHVYVCDQTRFSEVQSDHDFYKIWREFCSGKAQDVQSLKLLVISKA